MILQTLQIKLSVFGLCLLVGKISLAHKNLHMKACEDTGGEYFGATVQKPQFDELPFCEFGDAAVGSLTVIEKHYYNTELAAVSSYKTNLRHASCVAFGASLVTGQRDAESLEICLFADGSLMEAQTFVRGPENADNLDMNRALGLTH